MKKMIKIADIFRSNLEDVNPHDDILRFLDSLTTDLNIDSHLPNELSSLLKSYLTTTYNEESLYFHLSLFM